MFDGMRHPGHVVLVAEAPDIHIHRRTGLVRFRVVDQKRLELVGQLNDAVLAVVQGRGLQLVAP